ncbi:ImmA/IrrE family metallo-endopeptidase [Tenacibaculum maritimum]|nr:ImmA/IrrE family metallo-endopeptidase [Tenacibaculum maritimum]MDB0600275.1 ImmA/IrrE family metallo-endopeptidase [Tenacibaculum maritimum]MDB0610785.1 ImmA/IrrE family metallo-endopeptidase [Tenacibaculum maritimum]
MKVISVDRDNDSPASCGWVNNDPIILINDNPEHNWETTRRRFSLMHEAGHIFFKGLIDDEVEEAFCNRFAASILLPDEALVSIIGKNRTSISLGELRRIKETYGLSIQSIIYRLNDLHLINDNSKSLMIEEYKNWRNEEKDFGVYDSKKEIPKRFFDLLRRALTESRIDRYKAHEISGMDIDSLKDKLLINDKIDLI